MKNFQSYDENVDSIGTSVTMPKSGSDKSKSIKKARSYNFRSLMKEGSKRFLGPTSAASAERRGTPEDITSNGEQAV